MQSLGTDYLSPSRFSGMVYLAAILYMLGGAIPPATFGATTIWTGADDNVWTNALNWTDGVPDDATQAVFTGSGASNLNIELPAETTLVGSLLFNDEASDPIVIQPTGHRNLLMQGGTSTIIEMQAGAPDVSVIMGTGGNDGVFSIPSSALGTVANWSTSTLALHGRWARGTSGSRPSYIYQGSGLIELHSPGSVHGSDTTSTLTFDMEPGGTVLLTGNASATLNYWDAIEVTGGTLIADREIASGRDSNASFTVDSATLTGNGRIGVSDNTLTIAMNSGAIVDPGRSGETGTLTFENSDVSFTEGSLLRLDLLNPTDHDALAFAQTNAGDDSVVPTLNLATTGVGVILDLNLLPGFAAGIDDEFQILSGYQAVNGFFKLSDGTVLEENAEFEEDSTLFRINYGGSSTILTVIPEPSSLLLLLVSGLGIFALRRHAVG